MIEPWNERIWQSLTGRRERATHALLFCGAEGLGKTHIATRYAEHLLDKTHGFSRASHPDFHVLCPEVDLDAEGSLLQRYGMRYYRTGEGRQPKSVISVDQVRALAATIVNYAHGSIKVVLVTPAHAMNLSAANALLKSLEEPPSDTVFILVSSRPDQLPATIRSRCSRVDFRVPPRELALSWLASRTEDPRLETALDAAAGAPLRAEEFLTSGYLDARAEVVRDIQSILAHRAVVAEIPARWKDLGIVTALQIFQGFLGDLIKTAFVQHPPGLANPDCLDWLQQTSKSINLERAFTLSKRIGSYLRDSNSPLDKNLVLEDYLLDLVNLGKT